VRPDGAIVLVGFVGAGKTTAALRIAAERRLRATDLDGLIEERAGASVPVLFARDGEGAFRDLEARVACELLGEVGRGDVVSMGAGAVTSERIRDALADHLVVWLDVDPELAWRRAGSSDRPLARDRHGFDQRHRERRALYGAVADAVVPANARVSLGRVHDAVERLREAPTGTRLLWAVSASAEYPVWIGRGVLGSTLGPSLPAPSRRFCVTDENVAPLWLSALGEIDGSVVIDPGESHKSLASAELVWRELTRQGMTRADHLVALGGGVVGDLAGFCAATYQRGVPVVQVPTSLVAQVDSAYGGKTGVDLPEAKNYVGAFHQPAAVLADPSTLDTLPAAEARAGYAEVIKTALIAGGSLWERVEADLTIDDATIFDCALCKLSVVAADERDSGRRQVLNLGHTVGHAIETASGYERYRHGEAVALGLLASLSLSGLPELRARVAELLAAHGLPTRLEGVDPATVRAATARDKKRTGERVPFVLVNAPGSVVHGCEVAPAELDRALEELCA
jgi:shikimate kinase/3-dehydroquinate synthase